MKTLCIYHGGCDDGFGAAWAVRRALGSDVEFYPGVYQKSPPDVTGRDVIMVDFSYKRPIIKEMTRTAKSILILDHHKTAAEDLSGLPPVPPPLEIELHGWRPDTGIAVLFDMERSGAGLAWNHFNDEPRPPFINYLEDRDLWRKSLPDGDAFTMALRSYPQDFETWDKIAWDVPRLIDEGRSILRYYRLRCEELKRCAYVATLAGVPIWITNAPYFAASEVAGELAERGLSFGACYFEVEPGRFQYSLRSRGEFDVSEIAKKFGGGGHKGAAGFTHSGLAHSCAGHTGGDSSLTPHCSQ